MLEFDSVMRAGHNLHNVPENRGASMRRHVAVIIVVCGFAATLTHAQGPKYKYEITKLIVNLPNATGMPRDTVSVAADGKGNILVLRRSQPPVLIYNREGKLLSSWG